jgi:hydroxyacylglutathione hydrolase
MLQLGIGFGSIGVVVIGLYLAYVHIRTKHRAFYTPLISQEVFDGLYVIKDDYVNFWLLRTKTGLIAFDTGMNRDVICAEMEKLNLRPEDVEAVFLSHSDAEHAGELKVFPNATIYMAKQEVQMVNGSTYRVPVIFLKNKLSVPYTTLEDGEVLNSSGVKVACVLTPGHTLGSMSYIVNDSMLFASDALNLRDGRVEVLDKLFVNMNLPLMEQSITKLSNLSGIKYLFTNHFGYSEDFGWAFSRWRANKLMCS